MIEMTVKQVLECSQAFSELAMKQWPGLVAYKLAKIEIELQNELDVYNKVRQQIIERYGDKDENGKLKLNENNEWVVNNENKSNYLKDMNEVLDKKIQIDIEQLTLQELIDSKEGFVPDNLKFLMPIIKK